MDENEKVWLAGLLAGTGTIYATRQGVVCLVVKSIKNVDMIERVATMAGVNMVNCKMNRKPAVRATIQGEKLRSLFKQIWPYLDNSRRRDYVTAVRKAQGAED